jgi:hypothetical protein
VGAVSPMPDAAARRAALVLPPHRYVVVAGSCAVHYHDAALAQKEAERLSGDLWVDLGPRGWRRWADAQ